MPWRADSRIIHLALRAMHEALERVDPEDIARILRGPELEYVCQLCSLVQDLGLCDEYPETQEEEDYDGD